MDIVDVLKDPDLLGHKRVLVPAALADAAEEIECLRAELATERTCNESLQVALTNLRAFYPPACGADRLIAEALTANAAQTSDRGEEE
mgnify:CR=1 FL=1